MLIAYFFIYNQVFWCYRLVSDVMIYYGADVIALGYCLVAKMLIASLIAQMLMSIM